MIALFAFTGCDSQNTQIKLPNASWEPIYFKSINEATNLAGLKELRKTTLNKGDIEVRVWRGFGLDPLEAVILNRTNGQFSAKYLKIDTYIEFGKADVQQLNSPKSGWESFWKQLVDKEILTLRDSSEINCGKGGIDGGSYVVEINQDKIYRTYKLSEAYSHGKCYEANQMEEIGNIIGEEFYFGTEECKRDEWFACTKARKSARE